MILVSSDLAISSHPSSKKISIPLFKSQIRTFDPKTCVTINQLLADLERKEVESVEDLLSSEDSNYKEKLGSVLNAKD